MTGVGRRDKPVSPHALGAVAVLVGLAWTMRSTPGGVLAVHWLAAPLALFVLGPRWSVAAVAGGALFAGIVGAVPWANLPARLLIDGLLPLAVAWAWLRAVGRALPAHLFVYLFAAVFVGTVLAVLATGTVQRLAWPDALGSVRAADGWIALLIMADGEAMITGFIVTGLAVYRPEWLQTFDERRYLRPPA
jgi:uncharacterized membrane protein